MHRLQNRHNEVPGMKGRTERATIRLLGSFEVRVDGTVTPARGWTRRSAAALVKILAMAPGHRAHREQVMDILWPDDSPGDAAPKLHKAAHFARKAAARLDAIVLRNDVVHLFPNAELTVDVVEFDELSQRALVDSDQATARAAIDRYRGELLPDDRYEEWASERRELLRLRHVNLLRLTHQWLAVTELEPSDEQAHVEVMRNHVAGGDPQAALLQYERLQRVLDRELGVEPGTTATELREHIAGTASSPPVLGRLRLVTNDEPAEPTPQHVLVGDLLAELSELNRRQAVVLRALAGAQRGYGDVAAAGVAS